MSPPPSEGAEVQNGSQKPWWRRLFGAEVPGVDWIDDKACKSETMLW